MPLRHAILVSLALALCGCAASPREAALVEQPSISDIARGYQSFEKITENVVRVNPEFAMLCIGATQRHVDSARGRHGPHANSGPSGTAWAAQLGLFGFVPLALSSLMYCETEE